MALGTVTIVARQDEGRMKTFKASFAGDGSYPTGGSTGLEALLRTAIETAAAAAADANVRGAEAVSIVDVQGAGGCGQYVPFWDFANQKLKVLDGGHATWAEVGNGTNLSTTTFQCTIVTK